MAKTVNYTPEMESTIREMYTGLDNKTEVAAIATAIGKSPASVRAKISTMGIYVKEAVEAKAASTNKQAIAEKIGAVAGLKDFEVEGLSKATKGALEKVLAALTNS